MSCELAILKVITKNISLKQISLIQRLAIKEFNCYLIICYVNYFSEFRITIDFCLFYI